MKQTLKKRGQKIAKKWAVFSERAKEDSKEHIQEKIIDRLSNARQVRLLMLEWALLIIVITSLALTQVFWYRESYSASAFVDGGGYIEGTVGNVNSLNPLFATTSSEKTLSKLMFATLSTIDYSGHVGLGLAESIVPDETGKIWTVKLKKDLKWSDGEPITIEDVAYTISVIKDPGANTIFDSNFTGVKIERPDPETIIFNLPASYADFASTLNIPILPSHILGETTPSKLLEHSFSTNPISSGAFTFNATQNITNDGEKLIYLTANDNYYKGRPMLDSFAVHAYANTSDIVDALSVGSITATADLSVAEESLATSGIVYEKQTSISNGIFAFLNTTSPLLSDLSLRQAIQRGVNTTELRSEIGSGEALDYPILRSQIELGSYPAMPEHDPASAKSAINEAGATGQTLRLATTSTGHFPELANQLETQLEQLGFVVELSIYNPGQEFIANVIRPRNYDILLYEIELGADPDLFAYYYSSQASASGLNLSNYQNSAVDEAILAARSTLSKPLRAAKYEAFLAHWVEDVPAIGIYQASLTYYLNKNARSFSEDDNLVYAVDRFSDVEYWAVNHAMKNRTP